MAPFFGLTGRKLHVAIWMEAWVAVSIFGYCSAGAGGVLNLPAFRQQCPTRDVTDTPANEKHQRPTIQGMSSMYRPALKALHTR